MTRWTRPLALALPAAALLAAALLGPAPTLAAEGDYEVVKVEDGGTVRGICRISEAVPAWDVKVFKDLDKGCKGDHKTERMVHGEDRALANCVVFLKEVKRGKDWPEAMRSDERTILIDQKGCTYVPHVQWMRKDTQIVIGNSDQADHNIHGYRESLENTQFNFISPPGSKKDDVSEAFLERHGKYLVKCDIHPWMSAYVHVVPHPYHDVTSEKATEGKKPGEYVLTDVPPGDYELVCWHEGMVETPNEKDGQIASYTYSEELVQTVKIAVEAGKTKDQDFVVQAPPAK
jgi:plastocyanin